MLVCTNTECLSEYPIIDGIPIIVADLRTYVSQNILAIISRGDLSDTVESLLGDCCGPGSALDVQRQHLSTYAFDHYGDLDPAESQTASVLPGSVLGLLRQGLAGVGQPDVNGPIIDIGCAVGRTSFELAEAFDELVLGVDMSFGMLKTAMGVLERGRVSYPRRRVGIVYDRREFPAAFESSPNVDFWVCDATCLPFGDLSFALAASLNVLDCLASPLEHLKELARVLRPGSKAIIATPYDWSVAATPVESWLGGHSQRSKDQGSSESMLRSLLAGGGHRDAIEELELLDETADIPWGLRLHERSCMKYLVHMVLAGKTDA